MKIHIKAQLSFIFLLLSILSSIRTQPVTPGRQLRRNLRAKTFENGRHNSGKNIQNENQPNGKEYTNKIINELGFQEDTSDIVCTEHATTKHAGICIFGHCWMFTHISYTEECI